MRIANYREIVLVYWVWLRLVVEGIIRDIRYFVVSELLYTISTSNTKYLSLILDIS